MTIASGTLLTFSAIGNREDLADQIYNISPTDTPFMGSIPSNKATAVKHEWQTDTLAAVDTSNAQLEGDEYTFSTPAVTTRCNNYTQISSKTVSVSGTQDAVNKAGRTREMVYQLMKRSKELKRDMEAIMTGNQAQVGSGANSTTARAMLSLCGWYTTNVSRGSGGASGNGTTTAATDATTGVRALNEALMKSTLQSTFTNGGDVDLIMAGPFNKQVISSFAGNVTKIQDISKSMGTLDTAIDVYKSDFGTHKIVCNRFSRDRDLHLLTTDLWAVSYLRPMQTKDIALTGDSTKAAITVEYTLEARNQAGSGIVADLSTS